MQRGAPPAARPRAGTHPVSSRSHDGGGSPSTPGSHPEPAPCAGPPPGAGRVYPPPIGGDLRIVACQPRTRACFSVAESFAEECIQV